MNKIFWVPLMIGLTVALIFGGCAAPAPATAPAPTAAPASTAASAPTTAPTPTASPKPTTAPVAKPIELRFSTNVPRASDVGEANQRWADKVWQDSGGKLKIQMYYSESLVKQVDIMRAVQTGIADIGYCLIGQSPSLTPLNMVTKLPFLGFTSQEAATAIHWELLKKFPEMEKEFQGLKVIMLAAYPPDQFHFTKKAVRIPADIKGVKIIARADWQIALINMGGVPVDLGGGDWYMGLDRGLVEGQIVHFPAAFAFKTLELLKYHTLFGEGGSGEAITASLMNPDSFNSLPPDLQKILLDSNKWMETEIIKGNKAALQQTIDWARKQNHTFINLTPEEIQLWVDGAKPALDKWISDNAAKGLPSKAIYEETMRLIKQYPK